MPSASLSPPLPRKEPSLLTVMIGSLYSIIISGAASFMARNTSIAYLVRFSKDPPYSSVLWFRISEHKDPSNLSPWISIASTPASLASFTQFFMDSLIAFSCSTEASLTKCCMSWCNLAYASFVTLSASAIFSANAASSPVALILAASCLSIIAWPISLPTPGTSYSG